MDTKSFATRMGILALCAATLYATTFGGFPFFKTWAAVILGALLLVAIVHTVRAFLKSRTAKSAKEQISRMQEAMDDAAAQRDAFGGLVEGRNRFAQAVRRAKATERNIEERANQLKEADRHSYTPAAGATWQELEAAARVLVKELHDAHYWCAQELRSSFAPGLLAPDYLPQTFNNSQARATDPGYVHSAGQDHRSWMRPQSHNRGYPTMQPSHTTPASGRAVTRVERKVVQMSAYEHLRRRNPGPYAGKVVQFPSRRPGSARW